MRAQEVRLSINNVKPNLSVAMKCFAIGGETSQQNTHNQYMAVTQLQLGEMCTVLWKLALLVF
jgi:hypothetical protein